MLKVATGGSAAMTAPVASASKLKLDSLFLQWFSLPDTQRLVSGGTRVGGSPCAR